MRIRLHANILMHALCHVMESRGDPIWLDIIWIMDFQLYYDEQLGRWVDKNAPDEGENKPPPPPMIPKGRL